MVAEIEMVKKLDLLDSVAYDKDRKEIRLHLLGIPNFNLMGVPVDYLTLDAINEDARLTRDGQTRFSKKGGPLGITLQQVVQTAEGYVIESNAFYGMNDAGLWVEKRNAYTVAKGGQEDSDLLRAVEGIFSRKFTEGNLFRNSDLLREGFTNVAYARSFRENARISNGKKKPITSVFGSTGRSENGRVLYGLKR